MRLEILIARRQLLIALFRRARASFPQLKVEPMQSSVHIVHGLEHLVALVVSQCLQPMFAAVEERKHRPDTMPEILDLSAG
jgi:hypothetical protein